VIALRPDLSERTALSKSALAEFDICATKSWFSRNARAPFVPTEKVVFGSAVDAGVEVLIVQKRAGFPPDAGQAERTAEAVVTSPQRNPAGVAVDMDGVYRALADFAVDPQGQMSPLASFDWQYAVTQRHLHAVIPPFGECDGHPDILIGPGDGTFGTVLDVKVAGKAKADNAVSLSVELGFYCLLVEAETGTRPATVGYLTWVRTKEPRWQVLTAPVTDLLIERTLYAARHYQYVKDAPEPFGGPRFASACADCPYRDECPIAYRVEE